MTNMLTAARNRRIHYPQALWEQTPYAGCIRLNRNLWVERRDMKKSSTAQCARAVSLFRGLYARVAHRLGVDVSYISRVARGERKSKVAEKALAKEFNKAVSAMKNSSVLSGEKPYM